jgi:hypothetical protein
MVKISSEGASRTGGNEVSESMNCRDIIFNDARQVAIKIFMYLFVYADGCRSGSASN